jgi:hypothetical protein
MLTFFYNLNTNQRMNMLMGVFILLLSFQLHALEFDHSHTSFTQLLQAHTETREAQSWVNYQSLNIHSRSSLHVYLRSLEAVSESQFQAFTPAERLTFLINAYNAFTLEWILLHYPVKSIKDTGSLFRSPWKKTFPGFKLLGGEFTLDKIEHDWIRGSFSEPRIHFAVNCASRGCPSLSRKAYTAMGLESELSVAEKEFFNNPRHFRLDVKSVQVSSILKWYGDDFKKVHGSLEAYITKKASEFGLLSHGAKVERVDFLDYDWSLNGN